MPGPGASAPGVLLRGFCSGGGVAGREGGEFVSSGDAWSCGCVCSQGGCLLSGRGVLPGVAWWRPPSQTATAVDGTHPTGMHSC